MSEKNRSRFKLDHLFKDKVDRRMKKGVKLEVALRTSAVTAEHKASVRARLAVKNQARKLKAKAKKDE